MKEGNVTVMVKDMDRAIDFYTTVLGLTLTKQWGKEWVELSIKGLTIGLHPQREERSGKGNLSIGFTVENMQKEKKQLEEKGVTFAFMTEDGPVKLAHFADPDGTPLYLCEVKKKP